MAGRVIVKGSFTNVSASARFTAALTASIASSPLTDTGGRFYAVAGGEILSQPVQGTFDAATKTWTVAVVPVAGVIYRISAPGYMPDCFVESAAYLPMPANADVVVNADSLVGLPGGETPVEYVTLTTVIASIDSKVATAVDEYFVAHPPAGGGGGVTDHGALTGLGADDHPQYLTAARGDLRYAALAPASPAPAPPAGQPVSRFQAGHAWTDAAGGWAVKTDIVMYGSQSWGFDSGAGTAENHVTRLEFPAPVDVRGKSLVLDCYISDPTKVTTFVASVDSGATGNSNSMNYPPLAARARDASAWSHWVADYGSAYDQIGAPDRSAMRRIALRVVTSGPVTFRINGTRFVTQRDLTPAHPNGVIILESDDGAGTNVLLHQVLSEYGIPGTINMIAENADRPDRLTTEQLRTWQADGWDVQGHAYALTTQNYLGLTEAEADEDMARLKGWLLANGFAGQFIAYPQGGYDETVKKVAARYFRGGRTVDATPMTAPGLRPYAIAAHSVNNADSISTITQIMDLRVASGVPCHLVFHHFEDAGDINTTIDAKGWTTGRLRAIIEHGLAQGYTFATYSQVYGDPPPAQAKPVTPDWLAADSGFAAWPCDPSMTSADHALTTQVQYVTRVKVTRDGSLSLAYFHVGTAGSSVTGGTIDVWNEAGARVGSVAIASHLGTTGPKAVPITVANRRAGEYVYVGIRAIFTGTAPQIRGVGGAPNLGVSGASSRYATYGTSLSSLASIDPAALAATGAGGPFPWVGLS